MQCRPDPDGKRERPDSGRAGLTLVEIAIVMAVMGIIMAIAMPNMQRTLDSYRVKSAAAEVATGIRYAQQESVTREVYHSVVFGTHDYSVQTYTYEVATPPDWEALEWVRLETWSLPLGVRLAGTTFGVNHRLVFQPQGRPSGAGAVYLEGGSGQSRVVIVNNAGGVRVETPP